MTEKQYEELSAKLNALIALSIRMVMSDAEFSQKSRGKKGMGDLARYLAALGLDSKSISKILGAPLPSVRTLLTPTRRK